VIFAAWTGIVVVLGQIGCEADRTKPHKTLTHNVFYVGMTADEALARFPPSYSLEPLAILHDYGPNGPTPTQMETDEYFTIANDDQMIPLFFNQKKRLVRASPEFDEE
jgi:hypothetical protein